MESNFKIRFEDEKYDRPEKHFVPKRELFQVEKLSRRITGISILLFLLLCVAVSAAYYDITTRLDKVHDTQAGKVQILSQDLESKFSAISVQYAKLEGVVNKIQTSVSKKETSDEMFLDLEKSIGSLKDSMKKVEKSIEEITASKADKKELINPSAEIDKAIDPIRKELKETAAQIKSLDEKFASELAGIAGKFDNVKSEFGKLQASASAQSANRVDKKALDIALENQQKLMLEKIDPLIKKIDEKDNELKGMRSKLKELEQSLKSIGQKQSSSSIQLKPIAPPSPSSPPASMPNTSSPKLIPSKSGTILEQDIE